MPTCCVVVVDIVVIVVVIVVAVAVFVELVEFVAGNGSLCVMLVNEMFLSQHTFLGTSFAQIKKKNVAYYIPMPHIRLPWHSP